MTISFDKALGVHAEALRIRAAKAKLISTNIANADTPGYKARDIDFNSALEQLVDMKSSSKLQASTTGHLGGGEGVLNSVDIQYRMPAQGSFDSNTVDVDLEKTAFSENSVRYLATLRFLSGRFQSMIKALRGE